MKPHSTLIQTDLIFDHNWSYLEYILSIVHQTSIIYGTSWYFFVASWSCGENISESVLIQSNVRLYKVMFDNYFDFYSNL